jgi:soluble lytic murein transglycosylase-like protein
MLYEPNELDMGTHYLRTQIDDLTGTSRRRWLPTTPKIGRKPGWAGPIIASRRVLETIPFTETRTYVATVLRNADMYRRIYGESRTGQPLSAARQVR